MSPEVVLSGLLSRFCAKAKTGRASGAGADQVRAGYQSQTCQGDRPRSSDALAAARRCPLIQRIWRYVQNSQRIRNRVRPTRRRHYR